MLRKDLKISLSMLKMYKVKLIAFISSILTEASLLARAKSIYYFSF